MDAVRDPLCLAHDDRHPGYFTCICRILRTARAQGPIKENSHAPICWCGLCIAASEGIHGGQA